MTQRVWYAAYGSNLSRVRFDHYIRGGTPDGATHEYPGCRDTSAPQKDTPWELDRELAFGGTSKTWGGGVAFVDPDIDAVTKARLYLVTVEQFSDVVAQENWLDPGAVTLGDVAGEVVVGDNQVYGLVLPLGSLDGDPVMTFTQHRGTKVVPPSMRYLHHVAVGLREAHDMSVDDVVSYLVPKRGVSGAFTAEELRAGLAPLIP